MERSELAVPYMQDTTPEPTAHTASRDALLIGLAAKMNERGMVITLGNDAFGTDLAPLSLTGTHIVKRLAYILLQHSESKLLIEGFTDSTGSVSHNQELSERRATAVRTALQEYGVARKRIAVRGFGETYPIAENDTAQNRLLNRRVEIVFSDANGKISRR